MSGIKMSRLAPLDLIFRIAVVGSAAGAQGTAAQTPAALTPIPARLGCRNRSAEDFVAKLFDRRVVSPFILVSTSAIIQCGHAARAGLTLLFVSFLLAACAGSVNPPTLTSAPTTKFDPGAAAIGQVSAVAAPGVAMEPEDLSRISREVQAELASRYPDRLMAANRSRRFGGVNVKVVFTQDRKSVV